MLSYPQLPSGHLRTFLKAFNTGRGLILGLLFGALLLPMSALGTGFPISLARSNSALHLRATTVPAGRITWFQGSRPDAVTNLVQIEGTPLVQHDFTLTGGAAAEFFRAAMFDTNAERAPIAASTSHSLAILTNGVIKTWGGNLNGEFGNGTYAQTVSNGVTHIACWDLANPNTVTNGDLGPLQQSSDSDWVSVAAGTGFTLALKANGTMWGWGDDTYGQLGFTNVSTNGGKYPFPVQIGSNQQWKAVFAYAYSSFAIRNDGTLWGWGNNGGSVLGLGPAYTNMNGALVPSNSVWIPTQVGTSSKLGQGRECSGAVFRGNTIRRFALGVGHYRFAFLCAGWICELQCGHRGCQ